MAKRLVRAFGALMAALLIVCLCAVPALAWPTSKSGRFELTISDSLVTQLLFYNKELWANENNGSMDYYIDQAWQQSGVEGTCGEPTLAADVFLAKEGTEGATRYDLSSLLNYLLAQSSAKLIEYVGSSRDCNIDYMMPMLFDESDYTFTQPDYELVTVEDTLDGEPVEYYYYVFEGKLKEVLGTHVTITTIPFDQPIDVCVDYAEGISHPYYGLVTEVAPHAYFEPIEEWNGDATNPMQFRSADGSDGLRFDATLGFKFIAPFDDGYIFDSVTCTVNGQEQVLEPTGETYYWNDGQEYPVYEVPPVAAGVTVAVNVHEPAHTINGDGTITFLEGDLPTAYKLDIVYGEGINGCIIPDAIYEEGLRNAFVVETDEGVDYYCWPDKGSIFMFEMDEEYRISGATLDPADAGEADASIWDVTVRLDAPATLTVATLQPGYTYVDTDAATGISVAVTPEDAVALDLASSTFKVTQVTDAGELAKIDDAVARGLEESGEDFTPNSRLAYDVWHVDANGQAIDGSLTWSNALRYSGYVTIPLPEGWTTENSLVYRYMEEDFGDGLETWINWVDATPSEDGTSFTVFADGSFGRYVLLSEAGAAPQKDGWVQEDGIWHYYQDGQMLVNGWASYAGSWYWLGADGSVMKEGWTTYNGRYVYIKDYRVVANGWVVWNGDYYYIKDHYAVANDWVQYNGNWYYLDASGRPVVNDWVEYNGKRYHFNGQGVCDAVA